MGHHKRRTELCSPLCSLLSCDWWYPLVVHCRQRGRKSEFGDGPHIFRLWPFSASAIVRDCGHRIFCLTFTDTSYAASNSRNALDYVFSIRCVGYVTSTWSTLHSVQYNAPASPASWQRMKFP